MYYKLPSVVVVSIVEAVVVVSVVVVSVSISWLFTISYNKKSGGLFNLSCKYLSILASAWNWLWFFLVLLSWPKPKVHHEGASFSIWREQRVNQVAGRNNRLSCTFAQLEVVFVCDINNMQWLAIAIWKRRREAKLDCAAFRGGNSKKNKVQFQ